MTRGQAFVRGVALLLTGTLVLLFSVAPAIATTLSQAVVAPVALFVAVAGVVLLQACADSLVGLVVFAERQN